MRHCDRPVASHINTTVSRVWSAVSTFAQEPSESPPYPAWVSSGNFSKWVLSSSSASIPPYFLRLVQKVASEIAGLRHSSRGKFTVYASRNILMICSLEKSFFIGIPYVDYEDISNIAVCAFAGNRSTSYYSLYCSFNGYEPRLQLGGWDHGPS